MILVFRLPFVPIRACAYRQHSQCIARGSNLIAFCSLFSSTFSLNMVAETGGNEATLLCSSLSCSNVEISTIEMYREDEDRRWGPTFMLYRCQSLAKWDLCMAGSLKATAQEMQVNMCESDMSKEVLFVQGLCDCSCSKCVDSGLVTGS